MPVADASAVPETGRRAMRRGNSPKVSCDGERQRQAPVVGIVYSLSGRPRVGVGLVCPASRWFLLFLIFWVRQQKKTPMPDDGRANVPDGTGSGILDEVTLRALLEHVPVTVYIDRLDETASNVYTSPRLESELGYTVEEWVTDKELYAKVLHPEDRDRILAEYRRTRDTDEPFRAEYRMMARDGTVHWFLDEAAVIRDETGQPAYCHGFLLDSTKQKELAEALRSSEEA